MSACKILSISVAIFGLSSAFASSPYKQSLTVKKNTYLNDGVFTGGQAGSGATLLGVRHAFSAKVELERVILDMGDREGRPAGAHPGYFQAAVDAKLNRATIDLAQLNMSKVSEQAFKNLLKKSPYIAKSEFTLDPDDKTATLVLTFKRPMQVEVFQMLAKGKPARIVVDMKPAKVSKVLSR